MNVLGYDSSPVVSGGTVFDLTTTKAFLRIDHTAEDGILLDYVREAQSEIESFLNRAILDQTITLTGNCPQLGDLVPLFRPPVQSITSAQYLDSTDTWQDITYEVITGEPPFLRLTGDVVDLNTETRVNFKVVYLTGDSTNVSDRVKGAIRELVILRYYSLPENRDKGATCIWRMLHDMRIPNMTFDVIPTVS